jgi:hypothetical protein
MRHILPSVAYKISVIRGSVYISSADSAPQQYPYRIQYSSLPMERRGEEEEWTYREDKK